MRARANPGGFSIAEIIVALLILGVGVLAMGASTGYIMTQIRASDLRTERVTAVRQAAETLRGSDWGALEQICANTRFPSARYEVSCEVALPAANLKRVELISVGPGYSDGHLLPSLADTMTISIAEPVE